MPPASLGGSPRSADPGSVQITVPVLGLGVCEILCAHFKSRVSVSYSLLALLYSSPIGLQSQMVPGLVFLVQDSQPGEPEVGLGPLVP